MAEITLVAETGRTTGSRPSNRLRAEGKVPAVVYGHGADPVAFTIEWRALRQALTTDAGLNALIDLELDGNTQLTIVKDLQRDPVRRDVIHVDFLRISRDEEIEVDVAIVLSGEAVQVDRADGVVELVIHTLTVKAKPGDIPTELSIDISGLEVGDAIRVGDIAMPSGVTTDIDPDEAVVLAKVESLEVEPEAGEGEEGDDTKADEAEG